MNPSNSLAKTFSVPMAPAVSGAANIELVEALDDAHALAIWLDSCRRFKSPHTTRSYHKEAMRFRMWLEHVRGDTPRLLAQADASAVNHYLDYLGDPQPFPHTILARYQKTRQPFDGPLKSTSVRQAIVILASMYERFREIKDLNGQPYVVFNPFALVRGSVTSAAESITQDADVLETPKFLSKEVWALVETHIDGEVARRPQDPGAHRDRWILKLLYHSWARRQEAASIKMGSFSKATGSWKLHIVGKGRKRKPIIATTSLMEALRAYREFNNLPPYPLPGEDKPAVLPLRGSNPTSAQTIYRTLKSVLEAVALTLAETQPGIAEILRMAGPHWMRHTGITHAVDNQVDVRYVSEQARHSDIRITMKTYYHAEDDDKRTQLEKK